MWGEGAPQKLRRPAGEDSAGCAATTTQASRFPGLAAGVPADEAVTGDENGDALEEHAVFLGRVVDCELGDAVALPGHGNARAARLVGRPGLRAERELAVLEEEDAGPGVAGFVVQGVDDLAKDVVRVATAVEDALDRLECVATARHRPLRMRRPWPGSRRARSAPCAPRGR